MMMMLKPDEAAIDEQTFIIVSQGKWPFGQLVVYEYWQF